MLKYHNNISLKNYNTFGIDVSTRHFYEAESLEDIHEFLSLGIEHPFLILGEGSNILFTKDFPGTILKPSIKGIQVIEETIDYYFVKVGAGENWDEFVQHCIDRKWGGIENLSFIPGTVGSAPVQNIGAYGMEVRDTIFQIKAVEIETRKDLWYMNAQCRFDYRDSIFKSNLKGKVIIYEVVFKFDKMHLFNTKYGSLEEELKKFDQINLQNIRQAVINIRKSKLPDPVETGNAGSFFKNPVVDMPFAQEMQSRFPDMPTYPVDERKTKLAAGWLIDQCGLKGYKQGNAAIHEKQALVLVNIGGATGKEILDLAQLVQKTVYEKFGIKLEPEVNIL